ncbi:predicted protein [Naegleria gruberi]|uniref:Predicted protein n=1 Tax=Naegleria gruberi TaxID=5762 RepID=D2V8P7_NAEGR|nr:uncharacterized protein NAEGRDRAFT_65233 [Naegleria gruberi]EFC46729.1 predicted protein [Naegleria gruberi]|eukprot:XP_002679473.1 predicted protein [Naegleria gruberi strain NEG-M]
MNHNNTRLSSLSSGVVIQATRQVRDLAAMETASTSLKSTPSEPVCKIVTSLNENTQQVDDKSLNCVQSDSRSDTVSSVRDLCRALSKKLSLTQQDKQKDRFQCLLDHVRYSNSGYHLENYCTYDKIVDCNIFSKRVPVSNVLIEEVTFKDFATLYISSKLKQSNLRLIEKEELERRYCLKLMATYSNFRPAKQSLEIQNSTGNETVIGGNYHDTIYCCEFTLPKSQTKSFILLEGNSVDSNHKFKQFLHVFRVYGEDLFSKKTFSHSKNLCDITIHTK